MPSCPLLQTPASAWGAKGPGSGQRWPWAREPELDQSPASELGLLM